MPFPQDPREGDFMAAPIKLPAIIPSVWRPSQRDLALATGWPIVHVAGGRLRTLAEFIFPIQRAEKRIWIHPDQIEGLARDGEGLFYLQEMFLPELFVTSSVHLAQTIKHQGWRLCLRVFLHDTQSLKSSLSVIERVRPDVICVMPALVFITVHREFSALHLPIVAAGLIRTPAERDHILEWGVSAEIGLPQLWQT